MAVTVTEIAVDHHGRMQADVVFTSTEATVDIPCKLAFVSSVQVERFGAAGGANTGRLVFEGDRGDLVVDGTVTLAREVIETGGTLGAETFTVTIFGA